MGIACNPYPPLKTAFKKTLNTALKTLIFCGGVCMIALSKVITPSPIAERRYFDWWLEEGGEMAVVSVIAWYVHPRDHYFNMDENTGA